MKFLFNCCKDTKGFHYSQINFTINYSYSFNLQTYKKTAQSIKFVHD